MYNSNYKFTKRERRFSVQQDLIIKPIQELVIAGKSYPVIEFAGRPKAILDRHIGAIYGVATREVNQAYKNNPEKFPEDFAFVATKDELQKIKTFDLFRNTRFTYPPRLFTHLGCNMLSSVLKGKVATGRIIEIMRAFTALERRIGEIEIIRCFESFKKAAEFCGLKGNQALLSASQATEKLTGYNVIELLGMSLESKVQQQKYIPTEIAKILSDRFHTKISAVHVNKKLEEEGFQQSYRDHKNRIKWRLLPNAQENGNEYAIYEDTEKKHSDGTPVLQIKWFEKIIAYLATCFNSEKQKIGQTQQ